MDLMQFHLAARFVLFGFLAACAANQEPDPPTAADSQGEPASAVEDSSRAELLEFLRRQDRALAELELDALDEVTAVRLNFDYTQSELESLAQLGNLRELTIWRDGEGRKGSEGEPAPTDNDLRSVATLTQLRTLRIGGWSAPFTDDGVTHLEAMPRLEQLFMIQAQALTDASMKSVAKLPALTELDVTYTKITNEGLANLLESSSLQVVRYGWAEESKRWLKKFRVLHPNASFAIE